MVKTEELAFDIFREMGNIGTGSAVTALSNIIETPITEKVPEVIRLGYENLIQSIGQEEERVLGILFPVSGEISGLLLFVWKQELVDGIFRSLVGTGAVLKELDEEKISVMKEISNIMASAYFKAISSYTHKKVELREPAVTVDMVGAVAAEPAGWTVGRGKDIVCIESSFTYPGAADESHLCFQMYRESSIEFLRSLGVAV